MFKGLRDVVGATWHVLWGRDKPKKRELLSKEEIAEHYAVKNKEKEIATEKGEPWFDILDIEIDYDNLANGAGSFELDANEIFLARLIKAGYQGKTDKDLIDQFFTHICRNVVLETYEQLQADPDQSRKLDNNRREHR